ncbi:MAG: alanine racemase, partial [Anaerolineae bacterium]|nr:alanine racemase [Anaerolineae bacterium]
MISLYDIMEVSNGQLYGEPGAQIFTDFCINPSSTTPNSLYVTLKNDHGDTHRYIDEAIAKGASGILCARPPDGDTTGISVIMVRDTVTALMNWAQHILGKAGVKVIGVTGSTGKSVAVEAISRVLSSRYQVLTSPHEVPDNRLGIPLALAKLTPEHQFVVLRLSPTQPGEMAAMLQAAQPQVGVILTVDHTHTNNFEHIEQLADELSLLVEFLPPAGLAALNYDDDRVREMANVTRAMITTVGIDSFGANLLAYNVIIGPNGTGFDLRYGSERFIGRWIPVPGKHQLYNILNALSVGRHFDISLEDGLKVLTELTPLPGRMNTLIGINDAILIDDTHSATPQSTLAALDWLASARDPQQRIIFVLGDMDHLGTHSQIGHRQVGQRATEVVDILITQGTEAAAAARAALDSGMDSQQIYTTYSTHDTIHALSTRFGLTPHDLVLIKGGASLRMEQVVQALLKDPADHIHLVRQSIQSEAVQLFQPTRPTWVEIDTDALAGNVRAIKDHIGQDVALLAVVKADAYGHGAVVAAQTALLNGATYLGVANLEEALQLRNAGINAPVLILSYTPVYAVREAIRHDLTITVYDLDLARAYDRAAREVGGRLRVHAKVDTGMGRLGV